MSQIDTNGIEIQDCYVICCNCEHKQFLKDVVVSESGGNLVFCQIKKNNVEQTDKCEQFQCLGWMVEGYKVKQITNKFKDLS